MKKALKIFRIVIVSVVALLLAVCILMQTPKAQTFLAQRIIPSLEKNLNGTIEVSKIHIRPFNAIVVKNLAVLDAKSPVKDGEALDTILKAESVVATFSIKGVFKKEGIHIRRASVKNGSFTLTSEAEGGNLKRFLGSKQKSKSDKEMGEIFDIGKLKIEGFRFRLVNLKKETAPKDFGIDWKDLDVMISSIEAKDLKLGEGYMTGTLKNLRASEKSGYVIESLSGKTKVGHGKTLIEELKLADGQSRLDLPEFSLSYDNTESFNSFTREVKLALSMRNSTLDFKSLAYFAPALKGKDICLEIGEGDAEGYVNDLSVNQLSFTERGSGVSGNVYCRLSGLSEIKNLQTTFSIEDLAFTSKGVGQLVRNASPSAKVNLDRFAAGKTLVFSGKGSGPVNKLKINGKITSDLGSMNADLTVLNLASKNSPAEIGGSFSTKEMNIGKLADVRQLGKCTMRGALDARLEKGETIVRLDTLFIDSLTALGYDYSNIAAAGTYSENAFDGRIVCNDPNLSFIFQGIFTLSDKTRNSLYKFYANIGYADLGALNLDKRGKISKVSGLVNANYLSVSRGDIIGDLDIRSIVLENDQGRHDIGDILIESHSNNDINRMNLNSKFANVSYVGTKPLTSIAGDLKALTLQREVPALFRKVVPDWKGDEYDVKLELHDARDILSFAMPGLYIADNTEIRLNVSKDGIVSSHINSPRLALGKNYLKNLNCVFDNKDGSLNGTVSSSELSTSAMSFLSNRITLFANDGHVGFSFTYDNGTSLADRGEIYLSGLLERDSDGNLLVHGKTLPSNVYYNGDGWSISSSKVEVDGKGVRIDNLTAACDDQSIKINGGFSSTKKDTLSLELVKFNVALVNRFLKQDFGIEGVATGRALLNSPWKDNAGVMMNLTCDSAKISGRRVGTLRLASSIDDRSKMHIIARNDMDGARTINLVGDLNTESKTVDADAIFDRMDIGYLSPLLSSVFSETGGALSGKVKVRGTLDDLSLSSEGARFDDLLLKVGFTKVPYYVSGPFHLSENGLIFDDMKIKDRYDGSGVISGGLIFENLKKIRMDTRIRMFGMECLDTEVNDNRNFYGKVSATGNVAITGPFNSILLDINATTDKEGNLHIPVDNASKDKSSDLLYFKGLQEEVRTDPYDLMINNLTTSGKKSNDFGVKLRINANPGIQAFVEIDRAAGNVLSGRGQGAIDINVRPNRNLFTINGDYTLNEGNFHFNAMNIAKRDFTIAEGSSIRFNGDVMDSDLDINGIYSTKASVATLIADTSAVSTRRTVNCGIGISGKLREPKLSFNIDVPDLDPTTKSKVESALNTEDKVQRQFLSLLISNGFIPEDQSGVVNNSNVLYTNVAEIMAGQLNNILQKLDIPLDLGLNYQSSESGTDIFDVAVSTKLFNDRVLVNGAFGNREYNNSSSQGDVVGDLDIEIKLDKPGQLRLNLFSHSADSYTSYLDNTQRSGIGIAYQKEFNSLKEFFTDLFNGKKKRSEHSRDVQTSSKAEANPEKEVNKIVITK